MQTLGTAVGRLLATYGVDTVFGIPGVHTVELYRGFDASGLRHIVARHEQSLGFMADGYARASGKPGVCFVITGPGVTNISTAMGQAYADSSPMLVISSVNALGRLGTGDGHLHEMRDQRALASAVTAFSHTITSPSELPEVVARAFAIFDGARPRPVHIEIPRDLLAAPAPDFAFGPVRLARPQASAAAIECAARALKEARRPLILAGGGAVQAATFVREAAESLGAPVLMTCNGRGILPPDHPLNVSFSASCPAVRAMIRESDVALALGTELGPTDYDAYEDGGFAIPGRLIRVEIDPEQMVRTRQPDLALLGDARATMAILAGLLQSANASPWGVPRAAEARQAAAADLGAAMATELSFLEALRDAAPEAIIVGDSTQAVYAGNLGFAAAAPRRWFNAATGFGALGFGLPAAIGAALAEPDRPVICLAGDGGLQFTLADLATAVETKARLTIVLNNNFGYGEIKQAMRQAGIEPVGVDLHTPDFCKIAEAYGWRAVRVGTREAIVAALRANAAGGAPSLIELMVGR
jgi:acetolactate synthase-1/2/3 large subunit